MTHLYPKELANAPLSPPCRLVLLFLTTPSGNSYRKKHCLPSHEKEQPSWQVGRDLQLPWGQKVFPQRKLLQPLFLWGGEPLAAKLQSEDNRPVAFRLTHPYPLGSHVACLLVLVCSCGKLGKMSQRQQPTGCPKAKVWRHG